MVYFAQPNEQEPTKVVQVKRRDFFYLSLLQ